MNIVVLTNESLKEELLSSVETTSENILWLEDISQLRANENGDVVIDLLFEKDHIGKLQECSGLVIINSVEDRLCETDASFVRINSWPTFLRSNLVEASCSGEDKRKITEEVFSSFNKKIEWLPDQVGFLTPRVISMIINEAFLSLHEGVSSEEEIDTAMKLGTNYPYGPFEWAEKIGMRKIFSLLQKLEQADVRYAPSSLLSQQESV